MKTFLILTVIDLISAFRIMWLDVNTQYASLSTDDNLYGLPRVEESYNLMVFVLLINIAVILYKLILYRYQRIDINSMWKRMLLFVYTIVSFSCMATGYYYIGLKRHENIINEYNILFKLPIYLFGKDFIQRDLTVEHLYTTLCIVLISIYFSYLIILIKSQKKIS